MFQAKAVIRKLEIRMVLSVSDDPFVADEVPEAAALQDPGSKRNRFDLLHPSLFHDLDHLRGIGSIVVSADLEQRPSIHIDGGIIYDGMAQDLLDSNDLASFVDYLVAVAEFF